MKTLVDTQSFIWFLEGNRQLPTTIRSLMGSADTELLVSIASLWEMAIKMQVKKLVLSGDIATIIDRASANGFEILPITTDHLLTLMKLTFIHRDPFDRIIVAQAVAEDLPLITSDDIISRYPVRRIWK
jgi:PIN domain nuclease of toxin-antitoxin system